MTERTLLNKHRGGESKRMNKSNGGMEEYEKSMEEE